MSVSLTSLSTYDFLNPTPNHVFLLLPYIDELQLQGNSHSSFKHLKIGELFPNVLQDDWKCVFQKYMACFKQKISFPQAFGHVTFCWSLFQTRVANLCFAYFSSAPRRFTHRTELESILTKFCALVLWRQSSGKFINGPNWFNRFRMAAVLNS